MKQDLHYKGTATPPYEPEWRVSQELIPYPDALSVMETRVTEIEKGAAPNLLWLLEHPPLYTAGTSAKAHDLIEPGRLPVFSSGRGGQYTYHGPGQRVVYVVSDLRGEKDVRCHVNRLEQWIIEVLKEFGIIGERRAGRVGIWVSHSGKEEKIAAIGVRVRRWIAYHGLALNVNPDLSHYNGIVPCGLAQFGVTSIHKLGIEALMAEVDNAFRKNWAVIQRPREQSAA